MFCRSLCVLLFIFFWPLCCLFFFDTRILITHLVSSNSSYYIYIIIAIASCTECNYMSYFISSLRFWGRVYESRSKMVAMAFEWSIRFRIRLLENYNKRTTHVHLKSSLKKKISSDNNRLDIIEILLQEEFVDTKWVIRIRIIKEQTTQWPKEKVQKDKQRSTKQTIIYTIQVIKAHATFLE